MLLLDPGRTRVRYLLAQLGVLLNHTTNIPTRRSTPSLPFRIAFGCAPVASPGPEHLSLFKPLYPLNSGPPLHPPPTLMCRPSCRLPYASRSGKWLLPPAPPLHQWPPSPVAAPIRAPPQCVLDRMVCTGRQRPRAIANTSPSPPTARADAKPRCSNARSGKARNLSVAPAPAAKARH